MKPARRWDRRGQTARRTGPSAIADLSPGLLKDYSASRPMTRWK